MSEHRSRRRMAGSDEHDILQWDVGDLMPPPLEVSTLFDAGPSSALRPLPSLPPPPALDAYLTNAWLPDEAQAGVPTSPARPGPAGAKRSRTRSAREAWPGAASPQAPPPPVPLAAAPLAAAAQQQAGRPQASGRETARQQLRREQLGLRRLRDQQRPGGASGAPAQGFWATVVRGLEAMIEAAEQESPTNESAPKKRR